MSSTKSEEEFTPLVDSSETEVTESVELGTQDSTLSENEDEEISPIAQISSNTIEVDTPSISTDNEDDEDGLACLDKIRSLLESGKSSKSKLSQIRDIINSTSGGKKKSRKVHKNQKKGKNSRKQRKGSRK
uniref:Uncharacterized protein n=1 Tax=viral metagenome TaxID=1070528 RepID=A0A6C0KLG1_9ZZZZ